MAEVDHLDRVASLIWETSRADESTISAIGARHVAEALAQAGMLTMDYAVGTRLVDRFDEVWRRFPEGWRYWTCNDRWSVGALTWTRMSQERGPFSVAEEAR